MEVVVVVALLEALQGEVVPQGQGVEQVEPQEQEVGHQGMGEDQREKGIQHHLAAVLDLLSELEIRFGLHSPLMVRVNQRV